MLPTYFISVTSFGPAINELEEAINERITERINGCTAYRKESVIDFVTKSVEAINEEFSYWLPMQVDKKETYDTELKRTLLFITSINPNLPNYKTISITTTKGYFGEFVTLFEEDEVEMISEFPPVTEE